MTEGIFRKRVVATQKLTNFRVGIDNYYYRLVDIDNIGIINRKRISRAKYPFYGPYKRLSIVKSPRISYTTGDIVFISGGRNVLIFEGIVNPFAVLKMARNARKQVMISVRSQERERKRIEKQQERERKRIEKLSKLLAYEPVIDEPVIDGQVCGYCSNIIPRNLLYCKVCGSTVYENYEHKKCKACGNTNALKFLFCIHCGNRLNL